MLLLIAALQFQSGLDDRVESLLKQMTVSEKISLCHGDSKFTTAAIPRLGIARRWMSDGPHGVREDVGPDTWEPAHRSDDYATFMPANVALAATWDPTLATEYGKTIGEEARARGKNIMLAPGVNILRTPLNGRNFEYMGEDPWLSSRMAVGYIQGEQSQGISSCVKHFACNNQEAERGSIDVEMDDRTLHEIYLPAFRAAVQEGGVMSVMAAYNRFRGTYCAENDLLLNQILKHDWGFKGLVMSDWAAVHSTDGSVRHGMDLEMGTEAPYNQFFLADPFERGIENGTYPMSLLDDKVRRNLRVILSTQHDERGGSFDTTQHQATARKVAESGMVLLKNENQTLPLQPSKLKSILVVGDNAVRRSAHEGGSAGIKALYEVTPLEGIVGRAATLANVTFSQGYRRKEYSRRKAVADDPSLTGRLAEQAVEAAKHSDVVIFIGGLYHGPGGDTEGSDRPDMKLPFGQDDLLRRISAVNKNLVVVLENGGPVEMPWLDHVAAIVEAWYPGMEGGNALAAVLFGDVNPSGKLPFTMPKQLADSPAHALGAYPGQQGVEEYKEGLLVGYRWFDTKSIQPLFPFGFGLSYTSFAYSNARVNSDALTIDLKNVGHRAGSEVVQLYVEPLAPRLPRPTKELKGFLKVLLNPGETKTLKLPIEPRSFAYYDPAQHLWSADAGQYRLLIGGSSRDVKASLNYRLSESTTFTEAPPK